MPAINQDAKRGVVNLEKITISLPEIVQLLGQAALDHSGVKDSRIQSGTGVRELDRFLERQNPSTHRSVRTAFTNLLAPFKEKNAKPPTRTPAQPTAEAICKLLDEFEVIDPVTNHRIQFRDVGELYNHHNLTWEKARSLAGVHGKNSVTYRKILKKLEKMNEQKLQDVLAFIEGDRPIESDNQFAWVQMLNSISGANKQKVVEVLLQEGFRQLEELNLTDIDALGDRFDIDLSPLMEGEMPSQDCAIFLLEKMPKQQLEAVTEIITSPSRYSAISQHVRNAMREHGLNPDVSGDVENFLALCSFDDQTTQGRQCLQEIKGMIASGEKPTQTCVHGLHGGVKAIKPISILKFIKIFHS